MRSAKLRLLAGVIVVPAFFLLSPAAARAGEPVAKPFLSAEQHALLEGLLHTHLNYFLSPDAITGSGLPLGGYKEGQRGRYNYSNPTEWGYALLAWIAAAEEGRISKAAAAARMETALNTMAVLQNKPDQNYDGLFYPYYYVANFDTGEDLAMPYHDARHDIPSIDNGFLYTSLLIAEGWSSLNGFAAAGGKANQIRRRMTFRMFLEPNGQYLGHVINADTHKLGEAHWDIYADEGAVMAWIAYLSGAVTLDEYKSIIRAMKRPERTWNLITVREAAWYNAMFTWGVRSLAGFPVAAWETGARNRYAESFAAAVEAHQAYADELGVHYAAFSDVMSQGWVAHFTPPTISGSLSPQAHAVPHALFVPLVIGPELKTGVRDRLLREIAELMTDTARYYHDGSDNHKPFGFEAAASAYKDAIGYTGIEARYTYETLSAAYIALSVFQGLNIHDGKKTLLHYAEAVPGYSQKVQEVLTYLYPVLRRVPEDYTTIQAAIDAAAPGDTVKVAAGPYDEQLTVNKSGITLLGENRNTAIRGPGGVPAVTVTGAAGSETIIAGFTIQGGTFSVRAGAGTSVTVEDNQLESMLQLDDGAAAVVRYNRFWNCALLQASGGNRLDFIGNKMATYGPNLGGLHLNGTEGTVMKNSFQQRWDGAVVLTGNSNMTIGGNTFIANGGWTGTAGIGIYNSGAVIHNNIVNGCAVYSGSWVGVGVDANASDVWLYNNVFTTVTGAGTSAQGVAVRAINSDLTARNNIFSQIGNGQEAVYFSGSGTADFAYNDLWNVTTAAQTSGLVEGPGNIRQDPLFSSDPLPFTLQSGSPCIDAGDPEATFNDLNGTRNDIGAYGGGFGERSDTVLNMTEMAWYQSTAPYNSTGAAAAQMILNYIRAGAGAALLTQNEIYEYARAPQAYGPELGADELDKVLGHFDPYDALVSGRNDSFDTQPGGNPYQGYNFSVVAHEPGAPQAMNDYMRDLCHWMAYTVPQESFVQNPVLVARPNTPAAVPIFGTYSRWVTVKGYVASRNPCPEPRTNPWYVPDFTVRGLWIKDPRIDGIGQDSYKTAAECADNYFLPLVSLDAYNGKYVQIAEPPDRQTKARVEIEVPLEDLGNLDLVGAQPLPGKSLLTSVRRKKRQWREIVDRHLLADREAVQAFENGRLGKPVLVKRSDRSYADYYLVPFGKQRAGSFVATAVVVLDAYDGHFKEASWTKTGERFLPLERAAAIQLTVRATRRRPRRTTAELVWEPNRHTASPYAPYWRIGLDREIYFVTQEGRVVKG